MRSFSPSFVSISDLADCADGHQSALHVFHQQKTSTWSASGCAEKSSQAPSSIDIQDLREEVSNGCT